MAIKTETKSRKEHKKFDFPKLMIHKTNKAIVLFSTETSGITLRVGNSTLKIGQITDQINFLFFRDYERSIIIQND